jgi:hypothetical protein
MPLDGSWISRGLLVLGGLLESFEDDDRWVRHMFSDGEGRACLVGALCITRQRLNIREDRAGAYLARAIRQHHRSGRLQSFNDRLCSGIEELRDTIRFACALAAVFTRLTSYRMRRGGQPATRRKANVPFAALQTSNGALP